MSVEPIEQTKQLLRDVNGTLVDVSLPQFRKYKATVSCTDQEAPILTGVWPGKVVDVTFVDETGIAEGSTGDTAGEITLSMMVTSWNTSRDEPEAQTQWEIELEEI